jgi:hypothetical protein
LTLVLRPSSTKAYFTRNLNFFTMILTAAYLACLLSGFFDYSKLFYGWTRDFWSDMPFCSIDIHTLVNYLSKAFLKLPQSFLHLTIFNVSIPPPDYRAMSRSLQNETWVLMREFLAIAAAACLKNLFFSLYGALHYWNTLLFKAFSTILSSLIILLTAWQRWMRWFCYCITLHF